MAVTTVENLGVAFRCGIVAGILFGFLIALLTAYSIYLYVTVTTSLRTGLVERQWGKVFGSRFMGIVIIVSLCTVILRITGVLRTTERRALFLIEQFAGAEVPTFLTNHYVLVVFIVVIFLVPISAVRSLRPYVVIAVLGVSACVISLVHTTYWFGRRYKEVGFDVGGRISLFSGDAASIISFIAESVADYQIVPIAWPGPQHLRLSTPNRLMRCYAITLITLFVFTTARGLFGYCAFQGENMTEHLRQTFGHLWYVRGTAAFELVIGICTIAAAVNPARFILLNVIEETADFPLGIWAISGFAIAMIAMVFIELGDVAMNVLTVIQTVACAVLTFILPEIVFLKVIGQSRPGHFGGAIVMIFVGLAFIAAALYEGIAA